MQTRTIPDDDYRRVLRKVRQNGRILRCFANCTVWIESFQERGLIVSRRLLFDEWPAGRATVCEYAREDEWTEDIAYLVDIPPGGPASAGIPARPIDPAPVLRGKDARVPLRFREVRKFGSPGETTVL